MGRTFINLSLVFEASAQINAAKSNVGAVKNSFYNTQKGIDNKIKNRANISNRLNHVQNQLNSIHTKIGKIHSTVESGANQYRNTDNRINSDFDRKQLVNCLVNVGSQFYNAFKEINDNINEYINDIKTRIEEERANRDPLPPLNRYDLIYEFLNSRSSTKDAALFALTRADMLAGLKSVYNSITGRDDMHDEAYKKQIKALIFAVEPSDKYVEIGKNLLKEYDEKVVDPVNYWNDVVEMCENAGEEYKYLQYMDKDTFKNIGHLLKYGQEGIESLEILLTDYSSAIATMDTLKQGLQQVEGNEVIIGYIDELIAEYNNKFNAMTKNIVDFAVDESFNVGFTSISTLTTGGLLDFTNGMHKLIWEFGGIEDKGDILGSLYASSDYSGDVVRAYEHYANILKSGQYTQEDVAICETLFELAKEIKIQEYQGIREFSTSETQEFIDGEIEALEDTYMNFGQV